MEKDKARALFYLVAPWVVTAACIFATGAIILTATQYQEQCNAYWITEMVECGCVDTVTPYPEFTIGAPSAIKITLPGEGGE